MNSLLEVCLVTLALTTGIVNSASAQPLQKGIHVQLPSTASATAMPDADQENALIVSVTSDGSVYVGASRVGPAALAETVKSALLDRTEKKLYIKADARASYANVIKVMDAVRASGAKSLGFITAQRDSAEPRTRVSPKGIQTWLACDCPRSQN
jgi:biopolymer transport protein TolR